MNKIALYMAGMTALAVSILGCVSPAKKDYTPEQRERAYANLCESCKDGVSALEARASTAMYFDSIDAKADGLSGAIAPKDNLMSKINQFYDSNGEIIAYVQRKEGEGRNAKIQSLGGLRMVRTGITLKEIKAKVEEKYISNPAKKDEILRGVARVSWSGYDSVDKHGRRFEVTSWNNRFYEVEVPFFKEMLVSKGGRFGPENDPANQIKEGDGNFVLGAFSTIVPEKE